MTSLVLDASLALQWFLEDENDRQYSLQVLAKLSETRAVVPTLWFFEVGNGLIMAHRRKRISLAQLQNYLGMLKPLPIDAADMSDVLELPALALQYGLTNYDAAYLGLAMKLKLPLATTDQQLLTAAASAGVDCVERRS